MRLNLPACLFALLCLVTAIVTPAPAAILVLTNISSEAVDFELKPDSGEAKTEKLLSNESRAYRCDKTATATFGPKDKPTTLDLDAYGIYYFANRNQKLELQGVKLEGTPPPAGAIPTAATTAKPHKVTVKLLVDDAERRTQPVWEAALKKRFALAADVMQAAANVTFEVVAVATWDIDPNAKDFAALSEDFNKVVQVAPAQLAIGYSSRKFPPAEGMMKAVPFAAPVVALQSHILIREGEPRSEAERVEVLVQQLARYLGANTSPDRVSALRAKLGDGQAAQARFRIGFDPLNLLAMNLVADDMRGGKITRMNELSSTTQTRLGRIYGTLVTAMPEEPLPEIYFSMLDRAGLQVPEGVVPAGAVLRPTKPARVERTRNAKEAAVHTVVKAVATRAEANAKLPTNGEGKRLTGDDLTAAYIQEAANAANMIEKDYRETAFLLGIGIALDDSTVLRDNPITGSFCKAVESDEDRRQRLAVLGLPTIRNRRDLCQHFVISAALTEMAGPELAETAGLLKEQNDMTKASGFSFADLCADFSGIEFAKRVKREPTELAIVAKKFSVADYVPKLDGFRDGVSAERFKSEFTSTTSAKFKQSYAAVWQRVRDLPLYAEKK